MSESQASCMRDDHIRSLLPLARVSVVNRRSRSGESRASSGAANARANGRLPCPDDASRCLVAPRTASVGIVQNDSRPRARRRVATHLAR